jgi:hypothetical protein
MGTIASTMVGSMAGSVIGHGISNAIFGGQSSVSFLFYFSQASSNILCCLSIIPFILIN